MAYMWSWVREKGSIFKGKCDHVLKPDMCRCACGTARRGVGVINYIPS